MKIDRVSYHFLSNLGDYQNEKVELSAVLEEGESPEEAIGKLKERVLALVGESSRKLEERRWKLMDTIDGLEKRLKTAQENWNATAEFLRTQGIKPDAPNAPIFTKLLPQSDEVVEPELVDEANQLEKIPF